MYIIPSILSWLVTKISSPHPSTQQMERNTTSPNHNFNLDVVGSFPVGTYTMYCETVCVMIVGGVELVEVRLRVVTISGL